MTALDLGVTFPERDAVAAANLEEISLPNELKTCSFQDEVSSIVTLKVSTPSILLLFAATEKLSTALSFGGYLLALFLVLETFSIDRNQLINLSRSDEKLDSTSVTDLQRKNYT